MSCCLIADASSNQTCRRTLLVTKQYVAYGEIIGHFLCSVISEGKVVALDKWGRKWNYLSMTPRLTTDYAKNYCNRTLIVKDIVENVVACLFGTQCISMTRKIRAMVSLPLLRRLCVHILILFKKQTSQLNDETNLPDLGDHNRPLWVMWRHRSRDL